MRRSFLTCQVVACYFLYVTGKQKLNDLGSMVFNLMLMNGVQFFSFWGPAFNGLISIHGCDCRISGTVEFH